MLLPYDRDAAKKGNFIRRAKCKKGKADADAATLELVKFAGIKSLFATKFSLGNRICLEKEEVKSWEKKWSLESCCRRWSGEKACSKWQNFFIPSQFSNFALTDL